MTRVLVAEHVRTGDRVTLATGVAADVVTRVHFRGPLGVAGVELALQGIGWRAFKPGDLVRVQRAIRTGRDLEEML